MYPLISIVIPAYNVGNYLERCLDSVLVQTYTEIEIIVINDGSVDNTRDILCGYENRDDRIRIIHRENKGLVETREEGIQCATGDYVGFVDADDYIESDMYERLVRNAVRYDADISQCGIICHNIDGSETKLYEGGRIKIYDREEGLKALLRGREMEPSLCNKIYKATLLSDSCLDSSIINNEDLLRNFVLFSRADSSVTENYCGYHYIKSEGSMSQDAEKTAEIARNVMRARKTILENAEDAIAKDALYSYITAVVGSYYETVRSNDVECKELSGECRQIIKEYAVISEVMDSLPHNLKNKVRLALISPKLYYFVQTFYSAARKSINKRCLRRI